MNANNSLHACQLSNTEKQHLGVGDKHEGYTAGSIGFSAKNGDWGTVKVVAAVERQAPKLIGSGTLAFYFCKEKPPIVREVKNLKFELCQTQMFPKILRASSPANSSCQTDRICCYMNDDSENTFVFADLFEEHLQCHEGEPCPMISDMRTGLKRIIIGGVAAILIVLSAPLITLWVTRNR